MNTKRALKLADFLETQIKDEWFDLRFFGTKGFNEKKCGSTTCAMGWATVCFPKSGLFLKDLSDDIDYETSYDGFAQGCRFSNPDAMLPEMGLFFVKEDGEEFVGSRAIKEFFECTNGDEEFAYIFYPTTWHGFDDGRVVTKKNLALKIREYISDKEKVTRQINNCEL
jgi:hypothetical protein